jgi:hypothetical protein
MATCPACGGRGCEDCGLTGTFEVTCCPLEWVDGQIFEMIEMVEFYEKGIPPVAGGLLDQMAYFVKFASFTSAETRPYKRELEH